MLNKLSVPGQMDLGGDKAEISDCYFFSLDQLRIQKYSQDQFKKLDTTLNPSLRVLLMHM